MCICYFHWVTIIRHCRWNCPRIAHNVRLNLPTIKFCPSNSPKKTYLINSRDQQTRRHDIRGPVYHPHVLHAQFSQRWAKVANVFCKKLCWKRKNRRLFWEAYSGSEDYQRVNIVPTHHVNRLYCISFYFWPLIRAHELMWINFPLHCFYFYYNATQIVYK